MNLPNHKIFLREEFFGMIAYNIIDKHYYFLDKNSADVIRDFLKNNVQNKDWEILKKELLKDNLYSSDISLINKKKENALSAPLRVFIDITHKCNLRCKHCFTDSGGINPTELSTEKIFDLLDQMKENGSFMFSIAGGEPLIRNDIFPIIKHARDNYIDVSITTNGLLVNEDIANHLNDLTLKTITVSVDGLEKSHDAIRGAGNFNKAIKNIEILKKICKNNQLSIKMTVNSLNIHEADDFIKLGEQLGVDSVKFNFIRPFGRAFINKDLLITRDQYVAFIKSTQKIKTKIGVVLPKTPLDNIDYEFIDCAFGCTGGKETCNIDFSGNFSPCAFLGKDFVVGNIKNEPFDVLWDKACQISRFKGNDGCLNCKKYKDCRAGCRSRALFGYGNIDAIDPFCVLTKNKVNQKISIRFNDDSFIVYDHCSKKYKKYSKLADIAKDYVEIFKNKQFREIHNKINVPLKIFFDVTNKCNGKCIHCYNNSGIAKNNEIDLGTIKKLSQEMHDLGIFQISLAGGEPFVREDIFSIIRVFNQNEIDVSITTNGLLLTKDKVDNLENLSIKSITISIDGVNREKYKEIRGVDGFELLNKNIDYLRKKFKGELSLRLSVMKDNCIPADVAKYAISKKFDCLKINKTHLLGRFKDHSQYLMSDAEYDDIVSQFSKLDIKDRIELEIPREKYLNKNPLPCSAGSKTVYIDSIGNIFPCSFIPQKYSFGNLKNNSLLSALSKNKEFSVNNEFCIACPAMEKSHNITKEKII
ncbi:MAG TPA: hypothetical protein DCW42_00220 [Bacteroidetes bacterium]|nr:hypothetical protein [Bacteroidota bacterium]